MFSESDKNRILEIKSHLEYMVHCLEKSEPIRMIHMSPFSNNIFIAGGCFSSLWHNEKVKDYDFFFRNKSSVDKVYEQYQSGDYDDFIESKEIYERSEEEPLITPNAITLSSPEKVQLIIKEDRIGKPVDIINQFDFAHLYWYYECGANKLYISENALRYTKSKTLHFLNRDREFKGERINRYKSRGWSVTPGLRQRLKDGA